MPKTKDATAVATATPVTTRAQELAQQMEKDQAAEATRAITEQAEAQAHAEAAEAERLQRLKAIQAHVEKDFTGEDLKAARAALETAMDDFVKVNHEYRERFQALRDVFDDQTLRPLPEGWKDYGNTLFRPAFASIEIKRPEPQKAIHDIAHEAFRKYYSFLGPVDLGRPYDL